MWNKIFIFLVSLSIILASTLAVALPQNGLLSTHLIVINNWHNTVHVKEGYFAVKDADVFSGTTLDWLMFSGSISNLGISYFRNGYWQLIPGCPIGNYNYGLKVWVSAAPWDPSMPVCDQL